MSDDRALIKAKDREIEVLKRRLDAIASTSTSTSSAHDSAEQIAEVRLSNSLCRNLELINLARRLRRRDGSSEDSLEHEVSQIERRDHHIRNASLRRWTVRNAYQAKTSPNQRVRGTSRPRQSAESRQRSKGGQQYVSPDGRDRDHNGHHHHPRVDDQRVPVQCE